MNDEHGCLGLCEMDWEAGICLGCGRTTDEIAGVVAQAEDAPVDGDD
jgi:predicted Fe-S protein YdhL (DUF1289 family)